MKQGLHQHPAAEHPIGLGQPMGAAPATGEGGGTEIAAADVLRQPVPELRSQRWGEGKRGSAHGIGSARSGLSQEHGSRWWA